MKSLKKKDSFWIRDLSLVPKSDTHIVMRKRYPHHDAVVGHTTDLFHRKLADVGKAGFT